MKKYLAVFVAPIEAYDKMKEEMQNQSPEQKQKEMEAWKQWMQDNKEHIVDHGGGVGSAKHVSQNGEMSDIRNEIGGYMVIQAESAEEAAGMFKEAPHFGLDGGGVEVMEVMQM